MDLLIQSLADDQQTRTLPVKLLHETSAAYFYFYPLQICFLTTNTFYNLHMIQKW